jgi:16S rRNA (uracil1498-N3)-methyltransferase
MHRFRVTRVADSEVIILADAGQVHHLKDVLRLAAGDEIVAYDGGGQECVCAIAGFGEQGVILNVKSRKTIAPPKTRLAVACALPKKGMDDIIDKLTQLGVDLIIPMRSARVVVRLSETAAVNRLERWRRLAASAAGQSQRSTLPELRPLTSVGDVISLAGPYDLRLIPTLSGEIKTIGEAVGARHPQNVLVLIGPEGDFTDQEVQAAGAAGFIPVSLGPRVLRVDTAAIAVAAYLKLSGSI